VGPVQKTAWLALAACVALGVWRAWQLDFLADDAFITFRYARHVAQGLGPVFNPGERVEGYTNSLEVAVLALAHWAGADLVWAGRAFSLAGGLAGVALAWRLARRAGSAATAWLAPLLVALHPSYAVWSGAGLETTVFGAWLTAAVLVSLSGPSDPRGFLAVSALGLLAGLTRPEGVVFYGLFVALALARGGWRGLIPGLLLFTSLGGLYFAARWSWFGALLPNTFYAKSAFTPAHLTRGLGYLAEFLVNPPNLPLAPLWALGALAAIRRRQLELVAVPALLVLLVAAEGGDGLPMYRFLVPALPCLGALAALGVDQLREDLGRRGLLAGLALAVAGAVGAFVPRHDAQYVNYRVQRDDEIPRWTEVGRALKAEFPAGTVLAAAPIGALGYYF
jgi:arabinofuranosyltransferase